MLQLKTRQTDGRGQVSNHEKMFTATECEVRGSFAMVSHSVFRTLRMKVRDCEMYLQILCVIGLHQAP